MKDGINESASAFAGMIKVVGIVVLSALFLGESSIFTTRQASILPLHYAPSLASCIILIPPPASQGYGRAANGSMR